MANYNNFQKLINPQALKICQLLDSDGYQAYIVGGCVRDLLLKQTPKDWDICTDASPEKVMQLFPKHYPTGLQHGTVTVAMGEGVENHFEVTTFRIDGEYTDGRRPNEVFFVMNVEQDLSRRDLTINAIAYDPISQRMIDPFNGIEDLKNGIIRAVGNPSFRFKEDGLRIMRVARFAARFKYEVDPLTLNSMTANLDTLKKVSKERIKDELCKILVSSNASRGLMILSISEAMDVVCPLLNLKNKSVYFLEQNRCQGELETRLAFLYAGYPIKEVTTELLNLKFSNKEIKKITFLLEILERYNQFAQKASPSTYKSFMALIKNHSPDRWENSYQEMLYLFDALKLDSKKLLEVYKDEIVFSKKEMQIDGDDLILLGIPPGPAIKTCLEACYLYILKYPKYNSEQYLTKYALEFYKGTLIE